MPVVDRAVDHECREWRALVDEERRLPSRRGARRVEPRFVAQDAAGDPRDAEQRDLRREALQLERCQRGVTESLEVDVAVPDLSVLEAATEHLRAEAIGGTQLV